MKNPITRANAQMEESNGQTIANPRRRVGRLPVGLLHVQLYVRRVGVVADSQDGAVEGEIMTFMAGKNEFDPYKD